MYSFYYSVCMAWDMALNLIQLGNIDSGGYSHV